MKIAPLAITAAALLIAGCGESQAQSEPDETRIREIVREYLMENPEVIRDALIELQLRERQAAQDEVRSAAVALQQELVSDPRAPSIGAEDAPITIVEFFDYNCSYCRVASGWVKEAMESYPDQIRVVFRDYPILDSRSGTSIEAARAALASMEQDKFEEMHFALYGESATLTSDRIDEIAEDIGLDVGQMRADMESDEYGELFADNMVLGEQIGVEGTPFFMVGDHIVAGADIEGLEAALMAELAGLEG